MEDWAEFCQRELSLTGFNPSALDLSGADLCVVTPDFLNTRLGGPKYIGDSLYKCLECLKARKAASKCVCVSVCVCVCVCVCWVGGWVGVPSSPLIPVLHMITEVF